MLVLKCTAISYNLFKRLYFNQGEKDMELSFTKILVILFVGFLVFGPDKLPALGRAAGKALSEFKQATSGLTQDIRKNDSENKEDKQM